MARKAEDTEPCLMCGQDPEECLCLDRDPEPSGIDEEEDNEADGF